MIDSEGCQFSQASEAWSPEFPAPTSFLGKATVGPKKADW